ncbi:MAG: phosphoribosylformylglycinamidine synthase subunit PurS [Candidatus Theseobacter exili]|nr:phosphoribosylformylglycinamidine synthase subunit PurS [Candidatus Theseobacter exili]
MQKARVFVMPKKSVLDPQGATVKHALNALSYGNVNNVRVGKPIEISLDEKNGSTLEELQEMCDQLLVNPNIEEYTIEVIKK